MGEAVNERQLIVSLSRKADECRVVTFASFSQILTSRRTELRTSLPSNIRVVAIPLPQPHILISACAMAAFSYVLAAILVLLGSLNRLDLVYVRNTSLSCGLLSARSIARKMIVKVPAMMEDEVGDHRVARALARVVFSYFDRQALSRAQILVANSKSLLRHLVATRHVVPVGRFLEIPPGIDLSLVERVRTEYRAGTKRWFQIGFIGSLFRWQGVEVLPEATAIVRREIPDVSLVIIGDGESRPAVEELCRRFSIPYEVTGFLPHEDALKRLQMTDVLVVPLGTTATKDSNVPMKIVEAWALGVPVVAGRTKALLDGGFQDRKEIFYCDPTPEGIAKALLELLNSDELRSSLTARGQQLAERYSYDRMAEELLTAGATTISQIRTSGTAHPYQGINPFFCSTS